MNSGPLRRGQAYQWRGITYRYLQRECLRAQRLALEQARDQAGTSGGRLAETGARAP